MHKLIVNRPEARNFVESFIPISWGRNYTIVYTLELDRYPLIELDNMEIYNINDPAHKAACNKIDNSLRGLCQKLSKLCHNKYRCRHTLHSMQDIPYVLCTDNQVKWPFNKNDLLIAKPCEGSRSRGVQKVMHGDTLSNPTQTHHIIEKYIDDKCPKFSVDGYICDDEIGVLAIWKNVYYEEDPMKFKYLKFPCTSLDTQVLNEKYISVVEELNEKTGCNNQLINIELILIGNQAVVMEINPRAGVNYLPIFHVTGYDALLVQENLLKGIPPVKTERQGYGICRYNHDFTLGDQVRYHQDKACFSIFNMCISHTYAVSYSPLIDLEALVEREYTRFIGHG